MGSYFSHFTHDPSEKELTILVKTGDQKRAGTDANVWIIIYDSEGRKTEQIKLGHPFKNDHERGAMCKFKACSGKCFGKPQKVEFWRDSFGFGHNWYLERIEVIDNIRKTKHVFPVHRWIRQDKHYFLHEYDCCLPQDDEHQEQRRQELKDVRRVYQYEVKVGPGGPAQIKTLPLEEQFSHEYKWDIIKCKGRFTLDTKLINWTVDKWESLSDLKKVYKYSLGEPHSLQCWNEDKYFGLQRVQGVNCCLLRLCDKIPENFGVTDELVAPFLEGLTIDEAIQQKRLFYVDLAITENIVCKDNRRVCSPLALFFLNRLKDLMPIAIQLTQRKGPENPIFLPSDPQNTWLLAKMYYNNADASYHQSIAHIAYTHFIMESICVCTHRNLSPSHPVFKILAPHFLFLIAINSRGLEKLVSPNGWVDKTMTIGRSGLFHLIRKATKVYQLTLHGAVPEEVKSRGLDDPKILPYYPYRDDAVRLYGIIRNYVTKLVNHFYDSEQRIAEDYEIQQWRTELVKDRNLGGCGLLGIPNEESNRFVCNTDIIDVVSAIISTCSLSHAAGNFQQYDEYAFPPNYPALLTNDWPTDKTPLTEQDILDRLPNKETTLDTMIISRLLSTKATQSLGDFETQYLFEPTVLTIVDEFKQELAKMSEDIKLRNRSKAFPYHWLDPEFIPNSISI